MKSDQPLRDRRADAVRAWTRFIEHGDGVAPRIRPEILRSWELSGAAITPDVSAAPLDDEVETAAYFSGSPLQLAVELARVPVTADEVVALKVGQVIELQRSPGEPVELSVNGKVVARGELVEVEGQLGVRVLSLAG